VLTVRESTMTALPNFPRLRDFMRSYDKSEATGRRWAREGRIALAHLGREPLVDVERTAELIREQGQQPKPDALRAKCRCEPGG
jgi:hypothetical protein